MLIVSACIAANASENPLHPYFSTAEGAHSLPDTAGFIGRWLVLEPIEVPVHSNTIFTDSYLRETFGKEFYKGQTSMWPRGGQKVAVGKKKLRWHALDSNMFNIKLFRFATNLNQPFYGVLFHVVTAIDCDEDIPDVRMSAGSNSASMWWINGQEALLLSGDRRMVQDDAMSQRITLKKGRNIVRGAIINGPGMSDFCLRFLDAGGNPVRNYTISTL